MNEVKEHRHLVERPPGLRRARDHSYRPRILRECHRARLQQDPKLRLSPPGRTTPV
jgi:hypothetical protein